MKILFTDEVRLATVTAIHDDANYPVSNIKHFFMKKIFKSTEATDTITITFSTVKAIDCFYCGFTNATSITAKFYDTGNTLLSTKTISVTKLGQTFTSIPDVKYCKVDLVADTDVYIGTISMGSAYTMPSPDAGVVKEYTDNSSVNKSPDGQFTMHKIPWLRKISLSITFSGVDLYNTIYAYFANNESPVWVDIYDAADGVIYPIYASVEFAKPKRKEYTYMVDINIEECR